MKDIQMDGLAKKFLKSMRDWIDKRIPEKTRDCLRTKIAVIVNKATVSGTTLYDVVLAGDYGLYLDLKTSLNSGSIDQTTFNREVDLLTLDNLDAVKTDTYNVGDYVVVGIIDNKLTNAFILFKSIKKGV